MSIKISSGIHSSKHMAVTVNSKSTQPHALDKMTISVWSKNVYAVDLSKHGGFSLIGDFVGGMKVNNLHARVHLDLAAAGATHPLHSKVAYVVGANVYYGPVPKAKIALMFVESKKGPTAQARHLADIQARYKKSAGEEFAFRFSFATAHTTFCDVFLFVEGNCPGINDLWYNFGNANISVIELRGKDVFSEVANTLSSVYHFANKPTAYPTPAKDQKDDTKSIDQIPVSSMCAQKEDPIVTDSGKRAYLPENLRRMYVGLPKDVLLLWDTDKGRYNLLTAVAEQENFIPDEAWVELLEDQARRLESIAMAYRLISLMGSQAKLMENNDEDDKENKGET